MIYIYNAIFFTAFVVINFLVLTLHKRYSHFRKLVFSVLKKNRVISIIIFSIFMIVPAYDFIRPDIIFENENTMMSELINLDIINFIGGVFTIFMVFLMFATVVSLAMHSLGFESHVYVSTYAFILIFGAVISIIFSMLLTFTPEQFTIATSVISFVVIFKFVFNRKIVKKIYSEISNIVNSELEKFRVKKNTNSEQ